MLYHVKDFLQVFLSLTSFLRFYFFFALSVTMRDIFVLCFKIQTEEKL